LEWTKAETELALGTQILGDRVESFTEIPYMELKVVIHEAEEGGYWAEVPAIPGCATQGDTFEELLANIHEAVEACLSVDVKPAKRTRKQRILEIAV
jgi:predicted RNase H-like HicB family nuclease